MEENLQDEGNEIEEDETQAIKESFEVEKRKVEEIHQDEPDKKKNKTVEEAMDPWEEK